MIDTKWKITRWPEDRLGDWLGNAVEKRDLRTSDILKLVRNGRVRFVVADVGSPLREVALEACYDFWKSEVETHVCDELNGGCVLEDFEGDYFYRASEWDDGSGIPIVLLFKYH